MVNYKKIQLRDSIPEKYKWKLESIYNDDKEWERDFNNVKKNISEISLYSGVLSNAEKLFEFLTIYENNFRIIDKLSVYAELKHFEDMANPNYRGLYQKANNLRALAEETSAFFKPEILKMPATLLKDIVNENEKLKKYAVYFNMIRAEKDFLLSEEEERVLAILSEGEMDFEDIHSTLIDSDMPRPTIKDDNGEEIQLSNSNFTIYSKNRDRRVRRDVFKSYNTELYKLRNTFATTLTSSIRHFCREAKIRGFDSSLEYTLKKDNVPTSVFENMIKTTEKNLKPFYEYIDLRKNLLNIDKVHVYDIPATIFDNVSKEYSYGEAIDILNKGLSVLGEEYSEVYLKGISNGWVDVYPNRGKKSGAYSIGAYDTMPYILLNYSGYLDGIFSLAHEIGHSMHTFYSNKNQPYVYSQYSMFNAEIASTANEILLVQHLLDSSDDKKMKASLIYYEMEQIRSIVYRQVMFAEFEKNIHSIIYKGGSVSSDELCALWMNLTRKYYSENVVIDKETAVEWARIPHFYYNFYVYKYVTGYAVANMFATSILRKEPNAVENYMKFLKSGGNGCPAEILNACGIDISEEQILQLVFDRFNYLYKELEIILNED